MINAWHAHLQCLMMPHTCKRLHAHPPWCFHTTPKHILLVSTFVFRRWIFWGHMHRHISACSRTHEQMLTQRKHTQKLTPKTHNQMLIRSLLTILQGVAGGDQLIDRQARAAWRKSRVQGCSWVQFFGGVSVLSVDTPPKTRYQYVAVYVMYVYKIVSFGVYVHFYVVVHAWKYACSE